jgi:hypothetical protein
MSLAAQRSGRDFGLAVGGAAVLVAAIARVRGGGDWWLPLAVGGVALALAGWATPRLLAGPARVWLALAERLALIGNALLLGVVYFAVLTPIGLAMRLAGQDPLERRPRPGSGWRPYPESRRDRRHFERMY